MEEVWRDIPGYIGIYQASSLGRVRSLPRKEPLKTKCGWVTERFMPGRVLRVYLSGGNGYYKVDLRVCGKRRKEYVHRLIAEAFIENPMGFPTVNHIDGDKGNNCVENLEWCTQADNLRHAVENGLRDPGVRKKRVAQYDLDGNLVRVWGSYKEVGEVMGYCVQNVWQCAKGKTKTAYGYKWKRVE